ncbi:hypothetical protein EWI61_12960 [Methylolobus aquaticus]|nr:hypothetical protein EWI61_12960 [Methylolobus aquaticus]
MERSLWQVVPLLVTTTLSAAAEKELPRAEISVRACLACHLLTGESGDGPAALTMPESRFLATMEAFRSGQRRGSVMNRIAAGFTEEEIRDMARVVANSGTRAK